MMGGLPFVEREDEGEGPEGLAARDEGVNVRAESVGEGASSWSSTTLEDE